MTAGLSVPGWGGVATSLALVAVAAAIAYRQQLHLTRELLVAAARAGIQLVAVGALLLILFRHTGLPGALGWVLVMIVIAGQVAARRGAGLPHAARAATIGVATGSGITLDELIASGALEDATAPVGRRDDIQAALDAGRGSDVDAELAQLKSSLTPAIEANAQERPQS
ncbi:ABC transporter permease [Nocardia nova]